MELDYIFKPSLVKKVTYVTHKGKKRDYKQPSHKHATPACEIIYVDYGTIYLTINETRLTLTAGECVFIPGGSEHSFYGEKGVPFDFLNIMFRGEIPEELFSRPLPVSKNCLELMERLKMESIQNMPYCKEMIASYLSELIILFLRQVNLSVPDKEPEEPYRRHYHSETVNKAMRILREEYMRPLNLLQLSKAVGISESHLRTLLRKETGENFSSILHKHRVEAAKHLLRESIYSLEEIAGAVGYQSLSFFFKIFKRFTGMTPKSYAVSLGDPSEK